MKYSKLRSEKIKPVLIILMLLCYGCSSVSNKDKQKQGYDKPEHLKWSRADKIEYDKAIVLLKKKQPNKAKPILDKLAISNPDIAVIFVNLSLISFNKKDYENAKKYSQHALSINNKSASANNLLGLIAVKQGRFKQAEKHYLEAIKLKPNYANAHYNIALMYDIYFHDLAQSIKHYKQYLELTGHKDKATAEWVEQLKYSVKK